MTSQHDRRQFLRNSLAVGAAATLAAGVSPHGSGLARTAPPGADSPANPRTRPGLVRWHADFTAACAAARRSGKPVLLFHMLGRLDERFC
jgi:hypothetical protein